MNELAKRMSELSPEKRQLLALFLQEEQRPAAGRSAYRAPESAVERTLAEIWALTLGVERVGLDDNFFELGGDSIQSIQIATRARRAGIPINTNLIFTHPTLVALASAVKTNDAPLVCALEVVPHTDLPVTPIQQWFFAQSLPHPEWWNQAVLLRIDRQYRPSTFEAAWRIVQEHHDALRLRFFPTGGVWTQRYEAASEVHGMDIIDLPAASAADAISAEANRWQQRLDLTRGPVARLVYLNCPDAPQARLLLTAHHLVIDGVSFRTILEDLQTVCARIEAGGAASLGPKTTSYGEWAKALTAWRQSPDCLAQLAYWRSQLSDAEPPMAAGLEGQSKSATTSFDASVTRAILQVLPLRLETTIEAALLYAFGRALTGWRGGNEHIIDIERHGREEISPEMDLSRTAGWFTSIFPHKLRIAADLGTGNAVREVANRLAQVPSRGMGYQVLRYLAPDTVAAELAACAPPEILFNYLGQFDQVANSGMAPAAESPGAFSHPDNPRSHPLQFTARVLRGRFEAALTYPEGCAGAPVLIDHFRTHLLEMLAEAKSSGSAHAVRAAYPDADLSDEDIAVLFAPAAEDGR